MIRNVSVPMDRYDTRLYLNITYSNCCSSTSISQQLSLHLICPRGKNNECFPLLIYIGGGGWRTINPERHIPELAFFAERGFVVASIEYRTTATARFPSQIEDVKTAIQFLRQNADRYSIDPTKVFLMGGSAGAYLAAMAGLTGGSDLFQVKHDGCFTDVVSGVVGLYGLYDFSIYSDYILHGNINDQLLPIKLFLKDCDPVGLFVASPTTYVERNDIPFLLLHGLSDSMVNPSQSICFHDRLIEANHPCELLLIENAGHADVQFSQPSIQEKVLSFLEQNINRG